MGVIGLRLSHLGAQLLYRSGEGMFETNLSQCSIPIEPDHGDGRENGKGSQ